MIIVFGSADSSVADTVMLCSDVLANRTIGSPFNTFVSNNGRAVPEAVASCAPLLESVQVGTGLVFPRDNASALYQNAGDGTPIATERTRNKINRTDRSFIRRGKYRMRRTSKSRDKS